MGPGQISGALVRGLSRKDLEATKLVSGNITGGSLKDYDTGEYGGEVIVVGQRLAEMLGVRAGDSLTLIYKEVAPELRKMGANVKVGA